eukprot:7699860-Karenia_brevis.AAC.1
MDSQSVWWEWYCTGCFKRTRVKDYENIPDDQRCQEEIKMKQREYDKKCKVNGCQHYSVHSKTLEKHGMDIHKWRC